MGSRSYARTYRNPWKYSDHDPRNHVGKYALDSGEFEKLQDKIIRNENYGPMVPHKPTYAELRDMERGSNPILLQNQAD